MDPERHFRTNSSNTSSSSSELFICFTSRFSSSSSSSMKISSKSILSPNRSREPSQICLSTSLSRRLKNSGSLKGGQASPMFPTGGGGVGGKKRGCGGFENPEPSSPKVTCIGQVRVKTKKKKQGNKMRSQKQRRTSSSSNSEPSFRKSEQIQMQMQMQMNGNKKWVHFPFTICEAVKAFGAELNCFLPCHNNKESKGEEREDESSCGTVFGRWLVAVEDGDGKGRGIELVVGDDEGKEENNGSEKRRHVFEGLDFKEKNDYKDGKGEVEEGRISICMPPKNALLLMRCRSDPVKMAELAKRFCQSSSTAPTLEEEDDEEEEEEKRDIQADTQKKAEEQVPMIVNNIEEVEEEGEEEEEKLVEVNVEVKEEEEMSEALVCDGEEQEKEREEVLVEDEILNVVCQEEENREIVTENEINEQQEVEVVDVVVVNQIQEETLAEEEDHQEEIMTILTPDSEQLELAKEEEEEEGKESKFHHGIESEEEKESNLVPGIESEEENEEGKEGIEKDEESTKPTSAASPSSSLSVHTEQEETDEESDGNSDEEKATHGEEEGEEIKADQSKERETVERESSVLPDCLLLMMYEPKLSMEVSKETWVCSTDFIRCVPTREKKTTQNEKPRDAPPKKRVSIDSKPPEMIQPPRWSCSFPAPVAIGTGVSMATMIEQKLVSAKGYEPFVLKRCKSEPMRSSAKLAPVTVTDACFWKDRQLEPHRSATFGVGVGAAGVGF